MTFDSPALNGVFVNQTFASGFFSQIIFHLPKEETENVSFQPTLLKAFGNYSMCSDIELSLRIR